MDAEIVVMLVLAVLFVVSALLVRRQPDPLDRLLDSSWGTRKADIASDVDRIRNQPPMA